MTGEIKGMKSLFDWTMHKMDTNFCLFLGSVSCFNASTFSGSAIFVHEHAPERDLWFDKDAYLIPRQQKARIGELLHSRLVGLMAAFTILISTVILVAPSSLGVNTVLDIHGAGRVCYSMSPSSSIFCSSLLLLFLKWNPTGRRRSATGFRDLSMCSVTF